MNNNQRNNQISKFIQSDWIVQSDKKNFDMRENNNTDSFICNGRSCDKLASVMIEESVGKFGQIRLYLCTDCIKNFKK